MHIFSPYTDLRQNSLEPSSDESIWPTFTDIMTVILMIFMFTMITLILKSSDLAQQLQTSVDTSTTLEKDLMQSRENEKTLALKVNNLDESLRNKEMEIILLGDETKMMKSTLEAKIA
ncbi:MAG: hypothetical protein HQK84_08655, partial [Nitrospinae bacterium]|nr:hypothetical protein [Nitrospinota bacterium]